MTPYAALKIIEGYRERLYDQRDTATIAAYQGEYLARVKQMPRIEELLVDRKGRELREQSPIEIAMNIKAWLHSSGHTIKVVPKEEMN
jgi:hypothetical protein